MKNAFSFYLEFWNVSQVVAPAILPLNASLTRNSKWSPPPEGRIKLNVDAAVDIGNCRVAVAVIVRDSSGAMLTGVSIFMLGKEEDTCDEKLFAYVKS